MMVIPRSTENGCRVNPIKIPNAYVTHQLDSETKHARIIITTLARNLQVTTTLTIHKRCLIIENVKVGSVTTFTLTS